MSSYSYCSSCKRNTSQSLPLYNHRFALKKENHAPVAVLQNPAHPTQENPSFLLNPHNFNFFPLQKRDFLHVEKRCCRWSVCPVLHIPSPPIIQYDKLYEQVVLKMTSTQKHLPRLSWLFPLLLIPCMLWFSPEIGAGVKNALLLCGRLIIPTLFPFMVVSNLLISTLPSPKSNENALSGITRKWFGVPSIGFFPFLLGALCGFPLGVYAAADLHRKQRLNEYELNRVVCFSNNTGPAFVVTGVGITLFHSWKIGILLYGTQLLAALLCGALLSHMDYRLPPVVKKNTIQHDAVPEERGFLTAVQKSTTGVLQVCGILVFFSSLAAFLSALTKNPFLLILIYPFLEVGGATALSASLFSFLPLASVVTAGIAISFAGISVHMQAALLLSGIRFSFSHYLGAKLLQAAIAAVFLTFILLLFPQLLDFPVPI